MLTLEDIVEMDNKKNEHLPWNKLNKSLKLKRIMDYASMLKEKDQLDDEKTTQLKQMLKDKLERKCLQRTKDVVYNKEEERIEFLVRFQNRLLPFIDTHGSTSPAAYFVLQPYFVFSSSSSLSLLSVFYSDASIEQITFISLM